MTTILLMLFFALMVSLKGGLLGHIAGLLGKADQWKEFRKNPIASALTKGKHVSAVLSGLLIWYLVDWQHGLAFAVAWFIAWSVSIGEEIGGIGEIRSIKFERVEKWYRYRPVIAQYNWGDYVVLMGPDDARDFSWRKGLHIGVYIGAILSLATGWQLIPAGATFPVIYFLGSTAYYQLHKRDSWFYAEPFFGAVIGAGISCWLHSKGLI